MTATPEEVEALFHDLWDSGVRMSIPDFRAAARFLHERGWSRAASPAPAEGRVLLDGLFDEVYDEAQYERVNRRLYVRPVAAAPAAPDKKENDHG